MHYLFSAFISGYSSANINENGRFVRGTMEDTLPRFYGHNQSKCSFSSSIARTHFEPHMLQCL